MIEHRRTGFIDAHLHCWDPARLSMNWLDDVPVLNRPCELPSYVSDLGRGGMALEGAILVESAVDDASLELELEWLVEQVAKPGPVMAAVSGWRPTAGEAACRRRLDAIEDAPGVVGVRQVMHGPTWAAEDLRDRRLSLALQEAGRRGLVVELCVRPDQLVAVVDLVAAAPETTVVLDHLGRPRTASPIEPAWNDALGRVAESPNVMTKMSGMVECAGGGDWSVDRFRPFVDAAIGHFGFDRVLWGGNWPLCSLGGSLERWLEATAEILASSGPRERAAILEGNARRVYGLSPDSKAV